MIYGLCNSARIEAFPGGRAICPTCGGDLIAKCGRLVQWHWAHAGDESPVGGWGYFREKSWFCDKYLGVKTDFFDCGKVSVCDNYEPCIVCSRSTRRGDGKQVVVDGEPVLRLICFDCHIDHLRGAG